MRTERKETVTRYTVTCDFCETMESDTTAMLTCRICDRHACYRCGVWDRDLDSPSPPWHCKPCWKIGEPYRVKIAAGRADYERVEDVAIDAWRDACRKEAKS